ncbi:MAG: RraA family protein [Pseudomonadota bacterium]
MIEEPPLLTIKENTNRPSAEQIRGFENVPTGFLTDAMGGEGALDQAIKPLSTTDLPFNFCGPALTCQCGPADILAALAALGRLQPGDVLISAAGGWQGCAAAGDRVTGMAKNGGAVAFVTDGLVRDYDGIVDVGMPVFCTGLSPNSPFANGPGTVGMPVEIGGKTVHSGDMLVGDRDGVVVVPFAEIDNVIEKLATVRELEGALDAKVRDGLAVPPDIIELLASDKVKFE